MPGNIVLPRHGDVLVDQVEDHTVFDLAMAPFKAKHAQFSGGPGQPLTPGLPENHGSGSRVRYQNGTLYQRADGVVCWVYGKIGERYDQARRGHRLARPTRLRRGRLHRGGARGTGSRTGRSTSGPTPEPST